MKHRSVVRGRPFLNFFFNRAGGCEAKSFASVLLRNVRPLLPVALLLSLLLHECYCVDNCVYCLLMFFHFRFFFFFLRVSFLKQSPRVHAIVSSQVVAKNRT